MFSTFFIIYLNFKNTPTEIVEKVFVVDKVNKTNYYLKNSEGRVLLKTNKTLLVGDVVKINSTLKKVKSINNIGLFNYELYLKGIGINYETYDNNVIIVRKQRSSNKSRVRNKLEAYFDYFILMNRDGVDEKIYYALIDLAIIHLVVVSGFHFNIIVKITNELLYFLKNKFIKNISILLIMFWYLLIIKFPFPALRVFINFCLLNFFVKDKSDKINLLGLNGLITLLIKPYALFSFSFILSYFIAFFQVILPKYLIKNNIIANLFIFYFSVPLIVSINYRISVFAPLFTILFTPLILIMYSIILLCIFIPIFSNFGILFIEIFEMIILSSNKYNVFLDIGYLSPSIALVYYLIIIITIYLCRKRIYYSLFPILILIILNFTPTIRGSVTFLNVGQGDCIIIKPAFSNKVMMIDAAKPYKTDTVNNIIIPYLKSLKIREITTLVLTHNDIDHAGGKDDLLRMFNVKKVIEKKQAKIIFDRFTFYDFLFDENYKSDNANSITLFTRINGLNYFFAGDITKSEEQDIIARLDKIEVDILKLAHHGSKTSSSKSFLLKTDPSIAIVMSKEGNSYNHPSKEVVDHLNTLKIKTLNTAIDGTIRIEHIFNINWLIKYYK